MIKLVYNNKAFDILNYFKISQSNNEVTFNDITIDFTGYTLADMPLKYQEVQIKECRDNENILTQGDVLFFGYVDTIELGKMHMSQEDRELTITLLSPLKLATVRTTTIIGTYNLSDAINKIFEPLINDGFIISELNITNSQILLSYIMQPIETIMNDLCRKKNLFWIIDENKNIKINSIDYLFGQNIAKRINNPKNEEGFLGIEPSIESTDYANVINIKNARLIYSASSNDIFFFFFLLKTVKNGDIVDFKYPISFSKTIAKRISYEKSEDTLVNTMILFLQDNNLDEVIYANYNARNDRITVQSSLGNVTYSDDEGEEGTIVLQRDSFFPELITGFKYNGNETIELNHLITDTALRYVKMKFIYSKEINKLKGIISKSGQIERTIDAKETWFTLSELTNYARNSLVENQNEINSIILKYDKDQGLKIGDVVEIDLPQFYCSGKFAVTKIEYSYMNKNEQIWDIVLKSSNIISSYIDIFRPSQVQETETQENSLVISEFTEEGINESHNIEEVQDED